MQRARDSGSHRRIHDFRHSTVRSFRRDRRDAHKGARASINGCGARDRVTLNHQTYNRGDRARVTVRVRDDGYVVVLHEDADGHVRVLFPVDPGDDNFLKGGQEYEIRGRGDREAFQVTRVEAARCTPPCRRIPITSTTSFATTIGITRSSMTTRALETIPRLR